MQADNKWAAVAKRKETNCQQIYLTTDKNRPNCYELKTAANQYEI